MNHSRRNFIAFLATGFTGGLGCSTSKTAGFQASAPSATASTASKSGLEFTLDPFIEKTRTQQYFRIDAVNDGIGILHVRVVNHTNDTTFLLEKKNVRLVPRGETASRGSLYRGTVENRLWNGGWRAARGLAPGFAQ